jgi:hypothetical protein
MRVALRRTLIPSFDLHPTTRVSPSNSKRSVESSEKRSTSLILSAELCERVFVSSRRLKSSEELRYQLELRPPSRKHVIVSSSRFNGPKGPLPRSENPTSCLYKARQQTALPWGFLPFDVFKHNQRPTPSLPHSTVLRLQVFSTSWRLVPVASPQPCFMLIPPMGFSLSEVSPFL